MLGFKHGFFFFKVSLTAQGFMHRRKPRSIVSFCDIEWNNNPCFATMGFMKIETYIMLIFATLWTSVCVPGSSRYCVPLTVSLSWMMLFRKFKGFHDKPFFFLRDGEIQGIILLLLKNCTNFVQGVGVNNAFPHNGKSFKKDNMLYREYYISWTVLTITLLRTELWRIHKRCYYQPFCWTSPNEAGINNDQKCHNKELLYKVTIMNLWNVRLYVHRVMYILS